MKRVISLDDFITSDLNPNLTYEKYIKFLERDIKKYFIKTSALVDVPCPGCGEKGKGAAYSKMALNFRVCFRCGSHYVSPRPQMLALAKFYKTSQAVRFWRSEVLKNNEAYIQHVHGPRINWIKDLLDEFVPKPSILLDFQSKHLVFLKKIMDDKIFQSVVLKDPLLFEQIQLLPKDAIICDKTDDANPYLGKVNVVTAFETVERMQNPNELFKTANRYCCFGGLFIITTASCSGFEYQALQAQAPNINPINRMNLMPLEILADKVKEAGFEILELSTPGQLDVEIVRKAVMNSTRLNIDPFWKYVFEKRDEKTWHGFQEFLQLNRLSSHIRIAARKRGNGS